MSVIARALLPCCCFAIFASVLTTKELTTLDFRPRSKSKVQDLRSKSKVSKSKGLIFWPLTYSSVNREPWRTKCAASVWLSSLGSRSAWCGVRVAGCRDCRLWNLTVLVVCGYKLQIAINSKGIKDFLVSCSPQFGLYPKSERFYRLNCTLYSYFPSPPLGFPKRKSSLMFITCHSSIRVPRSPHFRWQ